MPDFDPRALAVVKRLNEAGFCTVLVGGCVRDSLLSIPLHDYDIATAALPQQVLEICADLRCVETGLKHGTVTVLSGGLPLEVTTFRKEGDYTDHRRPDKVTFTGDLSLDLARRDFTINAMGLEQNAKAKQAMQSLFISCPQALDEMTLTHKTDFYERANRVWRICCRLWTTPIRRMYVSVIRA